MMKKGFTLVEILVAIGIMSLIVGIGGISYRDFSNRQQVSSATREIRQALRLAQTRAFSGEKPAGCVGSLISYSFRTDRQNALTVEVTPPPTPTPTPIAPGSGLYGEYFSESNFTGSTFNRIDSTVNYNWGGSETIHGVNLGGSFSARWTGYVMAPVSGTYTFYVTTDDGQRLWVNNVQLTNDWNSHAATMRSGTINLVAGVKSPIRLEYFDGGSDASVRLEASGPGIPRQIIAQQFLYPPDSYVVPTTPTPVPACATVQTIADPSFRPFSNSASDFTRIFTPPNIPGSRIVGVQISFDDNGGDREAFRTVTFNNGTTTNTMTSACNNGSGGWVDVCTNSTPHSYIIPNYATNPSLSITSLSVRFRGSDTVDFNSLSWQYLGSCATPTPVVTPTPVPTPGPETYIVEALCSGVETPIVVQTLNIPPGISLSNFAPVTFKSVDGGTNIPSGEEETITVLSPVNNYSESVSIKSSGDIE